MHRSSSGLNCDIAMTTFPKISIVTPSFNQGKFLEKTILSVIEQDYPNLEYIIIDGGSTDESVEIVKKYAKHLAYSGSRSKMISRRRGMRRRGVHDSTLRSRRRANTDSALIWNRNWVSEQGRGQSHVINKGFERTTGEIFG